MTEEWRYINGFSELYQISNKGRIRSFQPRWKKPRMINASIDLNGYKIVSLVCNGKKNTRTVHTLVAEHFLDIPELNVNHKNGNKRDNKLSNLEYVTKSENSKHAIKTGLLKPNFENIAIKKRKPVCQIDVKSNEVIAKYESAHEASRITGINRGNISLCCREGSSTCGYYWKFI